MRARRNDSSRRVTETGLWALVCSVAAVAMFAGCSGDNGAGAGESCTNTSDCQSGLLCRNEICQRPGGGGDTGTDAGETIQQEDYLISFSERNQNADPPQRTLNVHNTATGETKNILPSGLSNCNNRACFVTGDFEHFFASQSIQGDTNLQRWEIGSDLKATGSPTSYIGGVRGVRMLETHVQYQQGQSGEQQTGFVKPAEGGTPTQVGTFPNDGSFLAAPQHDRAVIFDPTGGQQLELRLGSLQEQNATYTIDGTNYQAGGAGSFFGGTTPAAFSPDGSRLTFITSAPNNYQQCTRSDPGDPYSGNCSRTGARCGNQDICARFEVTAHIIDMEYADQLGQQCDFQSDCEGTHFCYEPTDQSDLNRCIPQRVVLGVPPTPPQNDMNGCQIVEQDQSVDFTSARPPISYDEQNRPYLVGRTDRECFQGFSQDAPAGQVVRLNPSEGDYTYVDGLPVDAHFDPSSCYSSDTNEYTLNTCRPFVYAAHLSPMANEVVFSGTNPDISTEGLASEQLHIWHGLRDQSQRWFVGNTDNIFQTSRSFDVHPMP